MSIGENIVFIIMTMFSFCVAVALYLGAAKGGFGISDVKVNQEYVFHIKVTLSDSSFYEFEFYSSYPYRSITEMKQNANRKKEKENEFIGFCYRKEHITLNRNQIMSVTMQREPTGLGKKDNKKSLRDMIKEKCKKERKA